MDGFLSIPCLSIKIPQYVFKSLIILRNNLESILSIKYVSTYNCCINFLL